MTSFREWREGGAGNSEDPVIRKVARAIQGMQRLEAEITELLGRSSRDQGPVQMALDKFRSSFMVLQSTLTTAISKNAENPERSDHPPRSIEQS